MDYQLVYQKLIKRAKTRPQLEGYTEKHHIVPRSLGGSDEEQNLVCLTAREHFIAHLLLHKIYGGVMTYALFMMSNSKKYSNRVYEQHRQHHALMLSEYITNHPTRGASISNALRGRKKSEQHIKRWKESRTNGKGWVVSEHTKKLKSVRFSGEGNGMFGKTHTPETREKISQANKQRVKCPHCGKIGGIAIMKRWHFDKCKTIKGSL